MQEALEVLEAYERTCFTGLPEVEQDINLEKSKKAIAVVSDCFKNNSEMCKLAVEFIDVLSIFMPCRFAENCKYEIAISPSWNESTSTFLSSLSVQELEQEDIFEAVERYRIEASNRYERHDFLGEIGLESEGKDASQKFPRATKEAEKQYLCELTNLTRAQLNQWFINGRRRILNSHHIKREYISIKSEVPTKPSPATPKQKPEAPKIMPPPTPKASRYSLRPRETIPKTEKLSEIYETAHSAHSDEFDNAHSDEEPGGRRKRNKRKFY